MAHGGSGGGLQASAVNAVNATVERVKKLVARGELRISEHGYDELDEDGLTAREIVEGVPDAVLVEDYPEYGKGPCVLLLQRDKDGEPVHVVWGIPKGHTAPTVLVTAYRPDPERWDTKFSQEAYVTRRTRTKLVHEGRFVAEVQVDVEYDETGWSPYLSVQNAYKLDDVRDALRQGDVEAASKLATVYTLTPAVVV